MFGVGCLDVWSWLPNWAVVRFKHLNSSDGSVISCTTVEFSKCSPWTTNVSLSISWDLVWNANSQVLPKSLQIQNSMRAGSSSMCFNKPSRPCSYTLMFENHCSIKAGYFQTNFLIFGISISWWSMGSEKFLTSFQKVFKTENRNEATLRI